MRPKKRPSMFQELAEKEKNDRNRNIITKGVSKMRDILMPATLSKSKQAITTRNAGTSPFFKLPPELRNRIYSYALGGNVIHISEPRPGKSFIKTSICRTPADHYDLPEDCKITGGSTMHSAIWKTVERRHQRCYTNHAPRHAITFDLTLVCKQIYLESARIPFAENKFVIQYPYKVGAWILRSFLVDRLNAAQVNSIDHINLHCLPDLLEKSEVDLLLRMKGLKSLTLIVLNHIPGQLEQSLSGLGFPPNGVLKERVDLDRLRLSQLSLSAVRVFMDVAVSRRNPEVEKWATTILNHWSRETEGIILGSPDEFLAIEAREMAEATSSWETNMSWIQQLQQLAQLGGTHHT
ncbi:hypothetical protein Q7P37_011051 [Cladosporium fusiforme]